MLACLEYGYRNINCLKMFVFLFICKLDAQNQTYQDSPVFHFFHNAPQFSLNLPSSEVYVPKLIQDLLNYINIASQSETETPRAAEDVRQHVQETELHHVLTWW